MVKLIYAVVLAFLINFTYTDNSFAMWWWYKGPWFVYESANNMHILVETDKGVDDDYNHRRLHFYDYGSCREPNWGYTHRDIQINDARDRRVWDMWAHDLTPGCQYKVRFKYRLRYTDLWHEVYGQFYAAPDGTPSEMEFYAFGDQRYLDSSNKDEVEKVSEAVMNHGGKKTFILNSGDLVYAGGYNFHDHDYWKDYFRNDHTRSLLGHMPMLPSPGNHDLQDGTGYDGGDATNYTRYFPYSGVTSHPSDVYYHRKYGRLNVYSLTSFPMDTDNYCSDYNANYKPKDKGGTGQYDWLESELAKIIDDPQQWKIVMMHAPIYTPDACNNQKDAKTYLVPLFEKYGVDIFVSGHNHYYARKTVNDIPYLILGGAGGGLSLDSKCKADKHCNGFDLVINKHHFAYCNLKGDVMTVDVFDDNNNKIETFTVDRSPKPDFNFTPETGGPPPLAVNFTDTSTGKRNKYQWDFGDGTVTDVEDGINASTTHTYTKEGTYTVKLTIWSAYGNNTKTITNVIDVWNLPDFSADPLEVDIGESVRFTDESAGDVTQWSWDFGDGNTSKEQNPVHKYTVNGMFTVKLNINRDSLSSETTTKTKIAYIKVRPYADFSYHTYGVCSAPCFGPVVNFYSCPPCGIVGPYTTHFFDKSGGDNLTYNWYFGDATTSTDENPVHDYDHIGRRTVLTVSDGTYKNSRSKYIELGSGMPSIKLVDDRLRLYLDNFIYMEENYTATLESKDGWFYYLVDGHVGEAETNSIQATLAEDFGIYVPELFFDYRNWTMKLDYLPKAEKIMWELEYIGENK